MDLSEKRHKKNSISRIYLLVKQTAVDIYQIRNDISWKHVLYYIVFLQTFTFYGVWLWLLKSTWPTFFFFYPFGQFCALGVTAGAHRLWSHRSYKANLPLRIFLSILFASCKQHDIYEWVRDHRVHHKYSDTYADPHSIKRGFFFSHIGWMVTKKPKEVHTKFEKLDLSDLENDPVVRFQKKYFNIWSTFWCYIVPTFIPWYFWNEDPWISFCAVAVARQGLILHYAWSVNSIAHRYGNKPYDRNICPTDDKIYAILALGEGWHNYHHAFPWDYRSSEIGGFKYNMTTSFIDLMGKIGWASHFKMATTEAVKKRAESKGDGSRIQYVGLINGS